MNPLILKYPRNDILHEFRKEKNTYTRCFSNNVPFLLTLLISGIPVQKTNKLLNGITILMMFLYCTSCIFTFTNTINCMIDDMKSFYIFTFITKGSGTVTWFTLYRKRHQINELLQHMNHLQKLSKSRVTRTVSVISKLSAIIFLGLVIFTPAVKTAIDNMSKPLTKPTCHEFWLPLEKGLKCTYFFFITVARQVANWSVPYSTTFFYSLYCLELQFKIKSFRKNILNFKGTDTSAIEFYDVASTCILKLEDTLSLSSLFVLFSNFFEMFRIFTHLMFMAPNELSLSRISNSMLYFLLTFFLFLVLIFTADSMQLHFYELRNSILTSNDIFLQRSEKASFVKKISMIEDKVYIRLTAWGIFEIKRSMILSAVASLITYGVLLQQFKK